MRMRFYPLVILLIGTNIFTASCQEKGSLTFVIDNTLSMGNDIYQVKQSADAITKIVFEEKSSLIKNMVLVTFNDPHATLEINTESRNYFKRHIHDISVGNPYGNSDCAEPSMNGILLGLKESLPGSFIYVFTDASAKDFWKSREIKNLCQKKQSQITFVLTGRCVGPLEAFQVYYDTATACSGFAFSISKTDVGKVLTTIKETISGNKTVITAIKIPPHKYTNVPFVIDDQTEYAIITASGSSVTLSVSGPQAVQEQVMWIRNAKAIKLSNPTPGNYTARVKGYTETSVYIVGRTDFLFSHGFSELEPKTLKDTTPQPIADAKTHLSILVTDPKHTVNIKSAQILDMNERVLKDLPLKQVANDFYITTPFVAPSKRFKVAVIGKAARDGKNIKRICKIPVTPQDPPKVIPKSKKPVIDISEGKLTEVEYGKTIKLTCKVSAYPEPKITWKDGRGATLKSQSSVVELPYEYISYLTITDVSQPETYSCHAGNDKGTESKTIKLVVKEPFNIKSAIKGQTEFEYGKRGTLKCDIKASVPMHIYWSYENEKTGISRQLSTSDTYKISADTKVLNINKMELNMVGNYTCKASLDRDSSKFVIFSTQVKINGLVLPKITAIDTMNIRKGSNVAIECHINGVPQPSMTWEYMAKDDSNFVSIRGSDNVLRISSVEEKHAGRYKCIAYNDVGNDEHVTTLTVLVSPKITSSSSVIYKGVEDKDALLRIPCAATGLPKPVIKWTVNGVTIAPNNKYSVEDGALVIKNPKLVDSQTYRCEAINDAGSVHATFQAIVLQVPKVSGQTTKRAITGTSVTIECIVVNVVPKPTITWKFMAKDDSKFVSIRGSDNVLRISNVEEKHAGRYKCIAHNDVGNDEHVTTLTVLTPPKIISSSSVIYKGVEDKDALLRIPCAATGLPKPVIKWTVNGVTIAPNNKYSIEDGALVIKNPKLVDSQTYRCESTNDAGSVHATFQASVLQVPKVSGQTTKRAITGTSVTIECIVVNVVPKPTITWEFMAKDDSKFVSIRGSDNVLRISNVEEKHAGRYKCIAHNDVGNDEHVTTLTVLTPPKITSSSSVIYKGVEDKDALLRIPCAATGLPKPVIKWTVNGVTIAPNNKYSIEDGALVIKNPKLVDSQTYRCESTNDAGSVHATFQASVLQVPKVSGQTTKKAITGTSVTIECIVVNVVPKPTITWEHMAKDNSKFVSIRGSDNVLRISSVEEKHAGRYKCIAQNDVGNDEHVTTLTVQFPPKITSSSSVIYTSVEEKDALLRIPCVATGLPKPAIKWTINGATIAENDKYSIADGALVIKNPKVSDSQTYRCEATNDAGSVHATFKADVLRAPKITSSSSVVYKSVEEKDALLKIPCATTGLPKPVVTWTVNGANITENEKYSFQDDALIIKIPKVSDSQTYRCDATNDAGSVHATFQASVLQIPTVSGDTTKSAITGSSVTIECMIGKGIPKPTITWQYMAKDDTKFLTIRESDNVIRIWGVEEKYAGRYKCIAHNDVGNAEHVTTLTVLAPPKISSSSSVIYKSLEDKDALLRIPCAATGLPKPVITWTVNSANISESEKYSIEDGALIIKNPKVSDSQTYKCEATNDAGSVHATFQANVLQTPKITSVDEKTVQSGASIEIECTVVKGVPAPTITWQFMGEHDSKFISMPGSKNKLYMSGVDKKYSGRYKCVAQNDVGTHEHVTTLTVQFAPVVTSKTNTTYKGLQGDVALRIPCDTSGVPQPVITWKTGGAAITPNARYTIIDGALIIKDPKKEDSKSYVCEAKNFLGVTETTFIAEIDTELEDYGTVKEVNILQGTAMKLECESDSTQSVRWFMEGNEMKIHEKHFNLNNVDITNEGNYTCRVSDMNGAHTLTYAVVVGFAPEFSFEQEETLFDYKGTEYDTLDCQVESKPPSDVVWTYNGEVLSGQQLQFLELSGNWGHYTCNVSNVHGAVQKNFDVISSNCLIKRKPENELTMPLIINQNSTWPVLDSTKDYLNVAPGQIVTFSCPSDKKTKNGLQKFPTINEVTATCDKQDIFLVDGKPYKVSDLHCTSEINSIVHKNHEKCLTETSELMRVGYDVHGFLETYEVCFDTSKNIPLYTRVLMSKSNRGPGITHNWYNYPGIGDGKSDVGYVCADSTSSCCYIKAQLVNARDFSDGPAQRSTYIDHLNAVPYWRPCDEAKDPWDNIESMIRSQLRTYSQFIAWSGTYKLQEKNGQTIPRYLWKLLRFNGEDSIAVVYVNDPAPVKEDILCTNICVDDNVPWMRNLDERTYCCEVNQILQTFGLRGTSIGESFDQALDKITPMK